MSIREFAESQGIKLLPWQEDALRAFDEGQPVVMSGGRRQGRTFLRKVVDDYTAMTSNETKENERG